MNSTHKASQSVCCERADISPPHTPRLCTIVNPPAAPSLAVQMAISTQGRRQYRRCPLGFSIVTFFFFSARGCFCDSQVSSQHVHMKCIHTAKGSPGPSRYEWNSSHCLFPHCHPTSLQCQLVHQSGFQAFIWTQCRHTTFPVSIVMPRPGIQSRVWHSLRLLQTTPKKIPQQLLNLHSRAGRNSYLFPVSLLFLCGDWPLEIVPADNRAACFCSVFPPPCLCFKSALTERRGAPSVCRSFVCVWLQGASKSIDRRRVAEDLAQCALSGDKR